MNVLFWGDVLVQPAKEHEKFLMSASRLTFGEDSASSDIESGKKSGCLVPNVVVSNPFDIAQPH